jgi:hypothetical protein
MENAQAPAPISFTDNEEESDSRPTPLFKKISGHSNFVKEWIAVSPHFYFDLFW